MPLIKQARAEQMTRRAIVLDLGDLNRQAEEIIAAARREADRLRAEATEEARRLVEGAEERGHEQGLARGVAEGRARGAEEGRREAREEWEARYRVLAERWEQALEAWETQWQDMLLAAREDVLRFAFEMARKIVIRVAALDPRVIEDQVAEALSMLCRPSAVRITIHPDDRPVVDAMLPALLARLTTCAHAAIVEDASVDRGGCVVHTGEGRIDATIRRQIERVAETLLPGASGGAAAPAPPEEGP
jgi:flagellar assembly protein FliH